MGSYVLPTGGVVMYQRMNYIDLVVSDPIPYPIGLVIFKQWTWWCTIMLNGLCEESLWAQAHWSWDLPKCTIWT